MLCTKYISKFFSGLIYHDSLSASGSVQSLLIPVSLLCLLHVSEGPGYPGGALVPHSAVPITGTGNLF